MQATPSKTAEVTNDTRGVPILARSLFRQMQEQGYSSDQIIGLSTALIGLVNEDLQKRLVAE